MDDADLREKLAEIDLQKKELGEAVARTKEFTMRSTEMCRASRTLIERTRAVVKRSRESLDANRP